MEIVGAAAVSSGRSNACTISRYTRGASSPAAISGSSTIQFKKTFRNIVATSVQLSADKPPSCGVMYRL